MVGEGAGREEMNGDVQDTPWLADMRQPLDPSTFEMMLEIFQAAASMQMPTENPETAACLDFPEEGITLRVRSNAMSRGSLAVNKELRSIGVKNPQAYVARIMQMTDIFEAAERFNGLIRAEDETGTLWMAKSVIKAAACARFYATPERLGYDVDDVLTMAQEEERRLRAAETKSE